MAALVAHRHLGKQASAARLVRYLYRQTEKRHTRHGSPGSTQTPGQASKRSTRDAHLNRTPSETKEAYNVGRCPGSAGTWKCKQAQHS
eukprot:1156478-Pelagomonas_calceolata.AAC.3